MAVNRVLYASQSVLISVGGYLKETAGTIDFNENDTAALKNAVPTLAGDAHHPNGFDFGVLPYILPVQTASVDMTIPQDDVVVFGNRGGVARLQKDVATTKCSVKAYLADYMKYSGRTGGDPFLIAGLNPAAGTAGAHGWTIDGTGNKTVRHDVSDFNFGAEADIGEAEQIGGLGDRGPLGGTTAQGNLAGEAWVENTPANVYTKGGLLEQLIWESRAGFESRVECYNSDAGVDKDGFSFYGILSSIAIDASKGAYPTLDLSWEGVGQTEYLNMGHKTAGGAALTATTGGLFYVDQCHPHTSDDVLIWGRERTYDTGLAGAEYTAGGAAGSQAKDVLLLIASNNLNYYQDSAVPLGNAFAGNDRVGLDPANIADTTIGHQGNTDTINSAKLSFDMPSETLSALGNPIESTIAAGLGGQTSVRKGNAMFSKPPYKASLTLDGQGLIMAGHEAYQTVANVTKRDEQVLPNEIQIGTLHAALAVDGTNTASRSMSNSVGDVGATYNISIEGTMATFYSTYQIAGPVATDGSSVNWNSNRDIEAGD